MYALKTLLEGRSPEERAFRLSKGQLDYRWRKARKTAGLTPENGYEAGVRLKDLRHTFAARTTFAAAATSRASWGGSAIAGRSRASCTADTRRTATPTCRAPPKRWAWSFRGGSRRTFRSRSPRPAWTGKSLSGDLTRPSRRGSPARTALNFSTCPIGMASAAGGKDTRKPTTGRPLRRPDPSAGQRASWTWANRWFVGSACATRFLCQPSMGRYPETRIPRRDNCRDGR